MLLLTYHRTVGPFAGLALATAALGAMTLTAAAAVTVLLITVAIAGTMLFVRAVLPASWRRPTVEVAPRPRIR